LKKIKKKKKKKKLRTQHSPDFKENVANIISLSVEQVMPLALQRLQAGDLVEAEKLCLQVLQMDSNNADANYLLGIMASKTGKKDVAIELLTRAIQSNPNNAEIHNNLGHIFNSSGRQDAAIDCFRKAISLNPDYAEAYNSLGVALKNTGELDEAIDSFRKALLLNPGFVEVHNNIGNAFLDSKRMDEAKGSFKEALALKPDFAMAHYNLGTVYHKTGKVDDAISCYKKSLSFNPHNAEAYNTLGLLSRDEGRMEEAITSIKKALSLKPDFPGAYNNLGLVFTEQGNMHEAVVNFRKATSLDSNYAEAYSNLGAALNQLGKLAEAIENLKTAVSIKPLYLEAHNNLGLVFLKLDKFNLAEDSFREALAIDPAYAHAHNNLGLVYNNKGDFDEAISHLREALEVKEDYFVAHSNLLLIMNYQPQITQQEIFKESLRFAKQQITSEARYSHLSSVKDASGRKLRIGYISPDFHKHSVSFFFKPLLEAHNREKFEIYCYSDVKIPDIMTSQLEAAADHWRPVVRKKDEEVIDQIIKDQIDILVDLTGHTRNNRLPMFAHKPAPIQVGWLGYPNTTGLQAIDYRFTDIIADPLAKDDEFYSEELIRLKGCFLCYHPYESPPGVAIPPFEESGAVTFGSFNNLAKINSRVIKVWSKILLGVPDSKLVLKTRQLNDEHVGKKYITMFIEEGISSDRIELMNMMPDRDSHLSVYNEIDIALDPFPYNGTTTTCEALWMGVPVVTLLGDRHAGRVGASILHAIGMQDILLADSSESYIELAIKLAGNKDLLINLRKDLRQQMKSSPLCDANSFARKVEEAYQNMWGRYLENHVKKNPQE